MSTFRPEPYTEYAAAPTPEFRASSRLEAVRSLGKYLGVTESRAAGLLEDRDAYCAEIRARQPLESQLRRRWLPGYPSPYVS